MFKALFSDKSVAQMFLQSDREKSCAVGGCLWIIGLEKERKEMSEELIPVQILLFLLSNWMFSSELLQGDII